MVDIGHEVGGVRLVVPALLGNQSNDGDGDALFVLIDRVVHGENLLHLWGEGTYSVWGGALTRTLYTMALSKCTEGPQSTQGSFEEGLWCPQAGRPSH